MWLSKTHYRNHRKDKQQKSGQLFGLFLFYNMIQQLLKYRFHLWFIVAILQAAFTDIFHDEAYYWLWSKHLAWGYFDHPPMIAWIIRIGTRFRRSRDFCSLGGCVDESCFYLSIRKASCPKKPTAFLEDYSVGFCVTNRRHYCCA
jgi:hypothetical protein